MSSARPVVAALLSAALCGVDGVAHAQQVHATGDYLQRMDTDADGKVSLTEYQDWLSYAFDSMDRNHDGLLAPGEQPGGRGKPLTRDAHRARLADTFKRQDRNRDGVLDARELAAPPQVK
jgi:Ca2+-binding EF-hand superfamily protein